MQHALIWPALLLATLGIIQAGIWIHGHNVAVRAANAGADAARGSHGGSREAYEIANDIAVAGGLDEVRVTVRRGATEVAVEVTGRAPVMLDLGLARITETAAAPVERVTQP